MKEKLRTHIETLFSDAPNTKKAIELKEELIQNSYDKYDDLIFDGWDDEKGLLLRGFSVETLQYEPLAVPIPVLLEKLGEGTGHGVA